MDLASRKLYKSVRQAHTNIVSSVAFRRHRPWELLSGALDMTVARWVNCVIVILHFSSFLYGIDPGGC